MFCPQCRADNPTDGENCVRCGCALPVEVSAAARLAAMQEAETLPLTQAPVPVESGSDDGIALAGAMAMGAAVPLRFFR